MSLVLILIGVVAGVLVFWAALVLALWLARPAELTVGEVLRLLPDVLRLIKRLAADPALPRGVRVRLWLLLGYLLLPFDLVPDFIPVIGYADDAVIVVLALRSVARAAGVEGLRRHWTGTEDGFAALVRFAGLARTS